MVVIDTSIIIDHLRSAASQSKLSVFVQNHPHEELAISLISIQALYEGQSTLQTEKERDLVTVLAGIKILPYTYDVAKLAGTLARDAQKPVELADAAIAATTIIHQSTLYTLNLKDFTLFDDLVLFIP